MNLPLDVGQITELGTILCPYHNSEFSFKSGDVKQWPLLIAELQEQMKSSAKPRARKKVIEDNED